MHLLLDMLQLDIRQFAQERNIMSAHRVQSHLVRSPASMAAVALTAELSYVSAMSVGKPSATELASDSVR